MSTELLGLLKENRLTISEALAVDDIGAIFVVFLFSDPHGLESRE